MSDLVVPRATVGEGHRAFVRRFTQLDDKAHFYANETFFREAWSDIEAVFGDEAEAFAHRHANLVFKPDAIVARVLEPTLGFLDEHQFSVRAWSSFRFDRLMTRCLWLYKLNIATVDRMDVFDRLQGATRSVLLIVHDDAPEGGLPASARLTALKGPADPALRHDDQLRARFGIRPRILNMIHSADEPADLVRELAVLHDGDSRRRLLREARAGLGARQSLHDELGGLFAENVAHDLDFERALGRTFDRVRPVADRATLDLLERVGCGERPGWLRVLAGLRASGAELPEWDLITLGATLAQADVPGETRVIDTTGYEGWRSA